MNFFNFVTFTLLICIVYGYNGVRHREWYNSNNCSGCSDSDVLIGYGQCYKDLKQVYRHCARVVTFDRYVHDTCHNLRGYLFYDSSTCYYKSDGSSYKTDCIDINDNIEECKESESVEDSTEITEDSTEITGSTESSSGHYLLVDSSLLMILTIVFIQV